MLSELLAGLQALDVSLSVADGELRFDAPVGAMTPELRESVSQHREEIVQIVSARQAAPRPEQSDDSRLAEQESTVAKWEECIEPPNPCQTCGGSMFWWNLLDEQRCMVCNPPTAGMRALEHAERIRKRQKMPGPPGVAGLLVELKRLTTTCKSAI